jgi:isocitrate dehydrogenase
VPGNDNRGSHLFLAKYWAEELAAQTDDAKLAAGFTAFAARLAADEDATENQGEAQESDAIMCGWFHGRHLFELEFGLIWNLV